MRKLIYIYLSHEYADLGLPPQSQKYLPNFSNFWKVVGQELQKLNLDYRLVRLYQDSFFEELDLNDIKRLARKGSRNGKMLLKLLRRGARIEHTESLRISKLERKSNRKIVYKKRDQFVAKRIDETLKDGETGILFMGVSHCVDAYLPKNIKIIYFRRAREAFLKAWRDFTEKHKKK